MKPESRELSEAERRMAEVLSHSERLPEGFGRALLNDLDRVLGGWFEYKKGCLELRLYRAASGIGVEISLKDCKLKTLKIL